MIASPYLNNADMFDQLNKEYKKALEDLTKANNLAVDGLTKSQFLSVLEQMIQSGDFLRYVYLDGRSQQITYIPFRETERLKSKIIELEKQIADLKK
jgi:hypothetical protein